MTPPGSNAPPPSPPLPPNIPVVTGAGLNAWTYFAEGKHPDTSAGLFIYGSPKKKDKDDKTDKDDWSDICTIQYIWSVCTICLLKWHKISGGCDFSTSFDCGKTTPTAGGGQRLVFKYGTPGAWYPDPDSPVPGVIPHIKHPDGSTSHSDEPTTTSGFAKPLIADFLSLLTSTRQSIGQYVAAVFTMCTYYLVFYVRVSSADKGKPNCTTIAVSLWNTIHQFYFDLDGGKLKLTKMDSSSSRMKSAQGAGWDTVTQSTSDRDQVSHVSGDSPDKTCSLIQAGQVAAASPRSFP